MKTESQEDPVLELFLDFIHNDITHHPEHLQFIDAVVLQRIKSLVGDNVDIDLNAILPVESPER